MWNSFRYFDRLILFVFDEQNLHKYFEINLIGSDELETGLNKSVTYFLFTDLIFISKYS